MTWQKYGKAKLQWNIGIFEKHQKQQFTVRDREEDKRNSIYSGYHQQHTNISKGEIKINS